MTVQLDADHIPTAIREPWTVDAVLALFREPLTELIHQAQLQHRRHFDPTEVQLSTLLNVKSGGCPEDCAYCPQSAHYATGVASTALLEPERVRAAALEALAAGASRFCMGAAWRAPTDRDIGALCKLIGVVRELGMESCLTVGMLSASQAQTLSEAGLDFYNHNLDTSESHYQTIISTRDYQERLDTLRHVGEAGMRICSGGILGLGESVTDRAEMLCTLANLPVGPESVPINLLVPVAGTPLADSAAVDVFDLVRTIAVARIIMPKARVRLSAGRRGLSDEGQALCFLAGANSIFYGDRLLTTENPDISADRALLARLGLRPV